MIAFTSRTGNVRNVVSRLGLKSVEIKDGLKIDSPFFIFTYTDGLGLVPKKAEDFMRVNSSYCKGVIASGNSNFGYNNFCASADKISKLYNIPIIHKIELRGFQKDYDLIIQKYNTLIRKEETIHETIS